MVVQKPPKQHTCIAEILLHVPCNRRVGDLQNGIDLIGNKPAVPGSLILLSVEYVVYNENVRLADESDQTAFVHRVVQVGA